MEGEGRSFIILFVSSLTSEINSKKRKRWDGRLVDRPPLSFTYQLFTFVWMMDMAWQIAGFLHSYAIPFHFILISVHLLFSMLFSEIRGVTWWTDREKRWGTRWEVEGLFLVSLVSLYPLPIPCRLKTWTGRWDYEMVNEILFTFYLHHMIRFQAVLSLSSFPFFTIPFIPSPSFHRQNGGGRTKKGKSKEWHAAACLISPSYRFFTVSC